MFIGHFSLRVYVCVEHLSGTHFEKFCYLISFLQVCEGLCIFWMGVLCQLCLSQIFFLVCYLSTLLMMSFYNGSYLRKSNLSLFCGLLCVLFNKSLPITILDLFL